MNLRWQSLQQAPLQGMERELVQGVKEDHARAIQPMNDTEQLAAELIHDLDGRPVPSR